MMPTSDFSGLVNSAWALARAAEMLPIASLERCMAGPLRAQDIKAHGTGFRALGFNPVPNRLLSIFWDEAFEFRLGILMLEVSLSGPPEYPGEFRPGIGRAHVRDPHRLDAGPWWFDAEEARGLTAPHA